MTKLRELMHFARWSKRKNDQKFDVSLKLRTQSGMAFKPFGANDLNDDKHTFYIAGCQTNESGCVQQIDETTNNHVHGDHLIDLPVQAFVGSDAPYLGTASLDFKEDAAGANVLHQMMNSLELVHVGNQEYRIFYQSATDSIAIDDTRQDTDKYWIKKVASGDTFVSIDVGVLGADRSIELIYDPVEQSSSANTEPKGKVVVIYSDGGPGGGNPSTS